MKIPGYRVHRKIGKGGMATVFLATQESFERKVALKIIADSAFGGRQHAEQFMQEARIVGSFSHPHIVPVYDVGRIEQFHYMAMDYLQGGDLISWIRSGLQPEECEQIIIQVARALHFAHGKGYIHRDVKPENILFREDNSAVLTDFGIAQPLRTANVEGQRLILGTPSYMSPEQIQGKTIDSRTDLYALGIMFYQMLTRELPYRAADIKSLALMHIKADLPKLPFALKRYQPILDKLLAKDPARRFDSALAFIKALENCRDGVDMSQVAMAIEDLQLVDHEDKGERTAGMTIEETAFRKLGLAKRYRLRCAISSDESQHFSLLFSQFTTRLLEWHDRYGGQCAELQLVFAIKPIMKVFVEEKIRTLYDEELFRFVKKLRVETQLTDLSGKKI